MQQQAYEPQERYDIRLQTADAYRAVYPLPAEELAQLAYFFEDRPELPLREDRRMNTPRAGRCAAGREEAPGGGRSGSELPEVLQPIA